MGTHKVPDSAHAQHVVIIGNSGSGKSATSRGAFVEPLLDAGKRVCVIDPTGIWWGLRFSESGDAGYEIPILGGQCGDSDIAPDDGERLARIVGTSNGSFVIDLSEMLIGDRHRFMTDFFSHLYRDNRRPLHLIVDEADEFAPQNPMPESKRLLHHFDRIVRRGRVRGFRVTMISQRPAVLHKNVMSQATVMIAMRLISPQDIEAARTWMKGRADLKAGAEVIESLSRLKTGEGWLWIPGDHVLKLAMFPMFKTFDSSRTPDDDTPAVEPPGEFPHRLKYAGLVRDLQRGREAQEEPPLPSRHQAIPTHRRSSRTAPARSPAGPNVERIKSEAFETGRRESFEAGKRLEQHFMEERLAGFRSNLTRRITDAVADEALNSLSFSPGHIGKDRAALVPSSQVPRAILAPAFIERFKAPQRPKPARRPHDQIAAHRAAGTALAGALYRYQFSHGLTWDQAALVAGLTTGNGYFYGGRKWLLTEGFAEEKDGRVELTGDGVREFNGAHEEPFALATLAAVWRPKIRAPGQLMLDVALQQSDGRITMRELAKATGVKPGNGYWFCGIAALRKAGLIEQTREDISIAPMLAIAEMQP